MRAQTRVKCLLLQKRFSRSLPLDEPLFRSDEIASLPFRLTVPM